MSFHTELLESRRMLSASINDDGVLEVFGTSQKDVIVISVNADNAAKLLADDRQLPEARQQVVRALEEAPRYRAAHQLLLEIAGKMDKGATTRPAATAPATRPTVMNGENPAIVKEPQS